MAVPYTILFVLKLIIITTTAVVFGWRIRSRRQRRQQQQQSESRPSYSDEKPLLLSRQAYASPAIEPLPNFDWEKQEPLKLRPFKPIYHITMALQTATPSSLIILDKNYLLRVTARREIISSYPSTVLGSIPSGLAPLREAYSYLLGTYLPARYPSSSSSSPLFTTSQIPLFPCPYGLGGTNYVNNAITSRSFPLDPVESSLSPDEILKVLGETVEDDIFLLIKDPARDEHVAVAFVCCHPSGFDPAEKLGKGLAAIHGPVPSYEKIGASMERFFSKLEVGKRVKRVNWSIQTHSDLYSPSGNHVHAEEEARELKEDEIKVEECRFRVELQSLMRFPQTGALMFSFKTFLYPLEDIKSEGLGGELADAIEGLGKGNAGGMRVYKGAVKWGTVMAAWLRA